MPDTNERLAALFAEVLTEHTIDWFGCSCGARFADVSIEPRNAHRAEMLVARLEVHEAELSDYAWTTPLFAILALSQVEEPNTR